MALKVRQAKPDELDAVMAIYPEAFPEEDLTELVAELFKDDAVFDLVAVKDDHIIGHAAFTRCASSDGADWLALLGPLCVDMSVHKQGTGSTLIKQGAVFLAELGCTEILVLGDPDYYGPRGFDHRSGVQTPYPLKPEWAEAWRSMTLNGSRRASGTLIPPAPWMKPEHWL